MVFNALPRKRMGIKDRNILSSLSIYKVYSYRERKPYHWHIVNLRGGHSRMKYDIVDRLV